MNDETERLLGTADAMVWAEAFCSQFNGRSITDGESDQGFVDPGTMVVWFANAIETARRIGRQETCPHDKQFSVSGDLICCATCGLVESV